MEQPTEDPRRRLLLRMLAAGMLGSGSARALAQVLGSPPSRLSPGRSVYRVAGEVTVDGRSVTMDTRIAGGAVVRTGSDGELVYVVGESAHIARSRTEVVVDATPADDSLVVKGIRLVQGALLSVFPGGRPVQVKTTLANVGIRGTGVYLEAAPDQTYFCTCYGTADVVAARDPSSRETVIATHHDRPLYILGGEPGGGNIRNAPFINHTDQELMLVEALVGREPPFVFPKSDYKAPRPRY